VSNSQAALGIDVGGSSVKLGIVRPDGEVISRATLPNSENVSPQSFFAPVVKVAGQLVADARSEGLLITSAGCGIPGTFEEGAEFTNLCNVPCLHGFAIRPHLERELALPVTVDNDACLAGGSPPIASVLSQGSDKRKDFSLIAEYADKYGYNPTGGSGTSAVPIYEVMAEKFSGYWAGQGDVNTALKEAAAGMEERVKQNQ
jgi:ROK family